MQRDTVENLDAPPALQREALNDVKAIQLGAARGHLGEVPTWGWRVAADSAPAIQSSASFQDAADGPQRRHCSVFAGNQLAMNGSGSILAQSAAFLKLAPQHQYEVLYRSRGSSVARRDGRPITPIDLIQRKISGTPHPPLHGAETDAVQSCHRAHRSACSNLGHHRPPLLLPPRQSFLSITRRSQFFPKRIRVICKSCGVVYQFLSQVPPPPGPLMLGKAPQ